MRLLQNYKLALLCAPVFLGLLLTGCETIETAKTIKTKPVIKSKAKKREKKAAPIDISKLSLEEIHNLAKYKECRRLLFKAKQELKKRPTVPVNIIAIKGLSEVVDVEKMFYLEPMAEQYPVDDSIRHFTCPNKIEDVKVFYYLKKGPAYASWYYYSYAGKEKGIDTRAPVDPHGQIMSRFGDVPPRLTLKMDKMKVISLHPSRTISNKDMDFILRNIALDSEKRISFEIYNKSGNQLTIRDIKLSLGPLHFHTDLKGKIVKLDPRERYSKTGIKTGFNKSGWFIKDGTKAVNLVARVVYQKKGRFKLLSTDMYIRLLDLGMNQKLK
jgi:hypothetical protein